MSTHYEAIGRCKVLREEVQQLYHQRNIAIDSLRAELRAVTGSITGTVYEFNAQATHKQLNEIDALNRKLMEAVAAFNDWAPAAGERPITIAEPHRQ